MYHKILIKLSEYSMKPSCEESEASEKKNQKREESKPPLTDESTNLCGSQSRQSRESTFIRDCATAGAAGCSASTPRSQGDVCKKQAFEYHSRRVSIEADMRRMYPRDNYIHPGNLFSSLIPRS